MSVFRILPFRGDTYELQYKPNSTTSLFTLKEMRDLHSTLGATLQDIEVEGYNSEYGYYGENNPPLPMSAVRDRDYEC